MGTMPKFIMLLLLLLLILILLLIYLLFSYKSPLHLKKTYIYSHRPDIDENLYNIQTFAASLTNSTS